jgi:hypothetical protein
VLGLAFKAYDPDHLMARKTSSASPWR